MDEYRTNDSNEQLIIGSQKTKLIDRILLSPYTKFLLPSLLVALIVPVTVYALMISPYVTDSSYSVTTCNIKDEYRVDCFPGKTTNESACEKVLCCWNDDENSCYHTVPSQHGYKPFSGIYYEGSKLVPRETNSPLGSKNIEQLYVDINSVDDNHVAIKLSNDYSTSDSRKRRDLKSFPNIAYDDLNDEDETTKNLLYFLPRDRRRRTVEIELDASSNLNAYVHYPEFSVTVARGNSENLILSTARGPLIVTETYWEWSLYLTDGSVYGLNDLELNGTTNWIYNNENGTITPAFLAISSNGQGASYYLDYKGPLEVQVLNVSNLVILRGIGVPEDLSIHIFSGPTPLEAVQQIALSLSSESSFNFPSDYNYGLHVCPNADLNSVQQSLDELNETIALLESSNVVWDSHCVNEQLASVLNRILSTEDLEFVKLAKKYLEDTGRSFSPHLSSMILEDEGNLHSELKNADLLMSNGSNYYVGVYHDEDVIYPDWRNTEVEKIASSYLTNYLTDIGSPESVWVRDSWPKDDTNSSLKSSTEDVDFSVFDYMPDSLERLMNNSTIPYNLLTSFKASHYLTHNSYSQEFRSFVSNSTVKTIAFIGPPGENGNTSWSGLRRSIRSAVGSGIVGKLPPPIYVCGTSEFDVSIHDELCIRWYQAALTLPYIISLPDRLPAASGVDSKLSTSASLNAVKALRLRASLATYQHTLMASFSKRGSPLMSPTSVHYPHNKLFTHTNDQFMWGEAILVGLVTLPGVYQVPMRIPGDISWLHLMGGAEAKPSETNGTTHVTATLGQIITLVRPGHVVPVHKDVSSTTTRETMASSNLTLSVNLNCGEEEEEEGESCSAYGEIYYGLESGDFLGIKINRTHLVFDNLLNSVKSHACEDEITNEAVYQTTFIQMVELLGSSSYEVNTELCDIQLNNVAISLA